LSRPLRTGSLGLLTESRQQTARRCLREEHLRYQEGIVPVVVTTEPLRVGTLGHHGQEARWLALQSGKWDDLTMAIDGVLRHASDETDEFERVRVEELMRGYCLRWERDRTDYKVIGVELEFRGPLLNPETGAPSRTFERAGKVDVLVEEVHSGRKFIVEHKFSGEDITPGSSFWARLRMGGQASGYIRGAELLGHQVDGLLYDVIAKPSLRPYKATPLELREYTKPKYRQCALCKKKGSPPAPHQVDLGEGRMVPCEDDPEGGPRRVCTDPGGRLYANQRAEDETVDEYRARVREDIAQHPEAYYQRGLVVRLEDQMREHDLETWQLGQLLRENRRLGIAPRNPDACQRYGSVCGYFPACNGEADINGHMFRRLDWVHPELAGDQKKETTP
jgi:hypothetical protein